MRKLISRVKDFDETGQFLVDKLPLKDRRPSEPGRAMLFDGILTQGQFPDIVLAGDFTISFYARIAPFIFFNSVVLGNFSAGFQNISFDASGNSFHIQYDAAGTPWTIPFPVGFNPANAWNAYTIIRSGNDTSFYINGVLLATDDGTNTGVGNFTFNRIGVDLIFNLYNGNLFDLRIYDGAVFSEKDIQYQLLNPTSIELHRRELIRHWKMDEESGWEMFDSSPNKDHALIVENQPVFDNVRHVGADVPFSYSNEKGYGLDFKFVESTFGAGRAAEEVIGGDVSVWGGGLNTMSVAFDFELTNASALGPTAYIISHGGPTLGFNVHKINNDLIVDGQWGSMTAVNFFPGFGKHRIAIMITDGSQKLFIDGVQIVTTTFAVTDIAQSSQHGAAVGPGYAGKIGNFKIWNNVELNDQALTTLSAGGNILLTPDLDVPFKTDVVPIWDGDDRFDVLDKPAVYRGDAQKNVKLTSSNCVTFDGVNDRYDFGQSVPLNGNNWVMHFRARLDSITGWTAFNNRAGGALGTIPGLSIGIFGAATDFGGIFLDDGLGNFVNFTNIPANLINSNTWYSFDIVWNTTFGVVFLYIDGQLRGINGNTALIGADFTGLNNLGFGSLPGGGGDVFDGQLCDLRVYIDNTGTAFDQEDINAIQSNKHPDHGTLFTWIPAAEGGGIFMWDVSGNDRHVGVLGGITANLWANTQDVFHYNMTKGFNDTFITDPALDGEIDTQLIPANNWARIELDVCFRTPPPGGGAFIIGSLTGGFTNMLIVGTGGIPNLTLAVGNGPFPVSAVTPVPNVHYTIRVNLDIPNNTASMELSTDGGPFVVIIPTFTFVGTPVGAFTTHFGGANFGGVDNCGWDMHVWNWRIWDDQNNLIQSLDCREGTGNVINDSSGNGNNGVTTLAADVDKWQHLGIMVDDVEDSARALVLHPSYPAGVNAAETQLDLRGGVLAPWWARLNSDTGAYFGGIRAIRLPIGWDLNQEKLSFNGKIISYGFIGIQPVLAQIGGAIILGVGAAGEVVTQIDGTTYSSAPIMQVGVTYDVNIIITPTTCKIYVNSDLVLDVTLLLPPLSGTDFELGFYTAGGIGWNGSLKNAVFDRNDVNVAIYPFCTKTGFLDISCNLNHVPINFGDAFPIPYLVPSNYSYQTPLNGAPTFSTFAETPFFDRIVDPETGTEVCYYMYEFACYESPRGDVLNINNNKVGNANQGVIIATEAGVSSYARRTPQPAQTNPGLDQMMRRLQNRFFPDERVDDNNV